MDKVLIDTDVILDFFFDRKPFSEGAVHILNLCERGKLKGYVTPIMLSNIYYLLSKTAKHDKIIEKLKMLLQIVEISSIDKTIVWNALNSNFKDFEDALQNYSAENQKGIKAIITRNIKDYKTSQLAIMTPETYLNTLL